MSLQSETAVERPIGDVPAVDAKPAWGPALKRTIAKFSSDQCTDLAAMLTYYALFSIFPALAALVALISLVASPNAIVETVADVLNKPPNDGSFDTLRSVVNDFNKSKGAGFALVAGVLVSLWSASGYVGGFGRALNRIYDVGEGRPVLKLRPWIYLVTVVQMVMMLAIVGAMSLSGSLAESVGSRIGLGEQAVQVWNIAKLPVAIAVAVLIIGLLYWATPNVRKPKRLFFSWGALIAFVAWIVASIGFAIYVALSAGASYQKTFGPFATIVLFLFWLWLTNIVLLFGAELDAELERTRQLKSGLPAEELILLPARDESALVGQAEKYDKLVEQAHELRMESSPEAERLGELYVPLDERRRSDERLASAMIASPGSPARPATRHMDTRNGGRRAVIGSDGEPVGTVSTAGDNDAIRPDYGPRRGLPGAVVDLPRGENLTKQEEDAMTIDRDRAARRDEALAEATAAREVRVRQNEQANAAKKARQEAERKAAAREKAKAAEITREQRWAQVDQVRSSFAPRDSAHREEVRAERAARRAEFDAEQAAKAAEQERPRPVSAATVAPEPVSSARLQRDREREQRRTAYFSGVPSRTPEDVPTTLRRDRRDG